MNATMRWAVVKPVLDRLRPTRVLEIGCGQGGFGSRIAARSEYVGIEMDRRSFDAASRRVGAMGGRVLHGTTDLLEPGERFDLVCAFEVVEHIEDDVGALASWREYLNPGGSVVVSVPAWPLRFGPSDEMAGHFRRYTPEDLDGVLVKGGYDDPGHTLYGWPLGYWLEPARHVAAQRRLRRTPQSMEDRTAGSGRFFQPLPVAGHAVSAATRPFAALQARRPHQGVGLVGWAKA